MTPNHTPHETESSTKDLSAADSPEQQLSDRESHGPDAILVAPPQTEHCFLPPSHSAGDFLPLSPPMSIADNIAGCTCLHSLPTCPLDRILLDFMASQGPAARASAIPEATTPAPLHLYVAGIFRSDTFTIHQPLSRMLSDVMSTFYHVQVPEKLGMVFKMHATMRVRFNSIWPQTLGLC